MHCPRCGTAATAGQQFCRGCGFSLERVAEILGDDAIQPVNTVHDRARLRERQQKLEQYAGIAGLTTFGLILVLFMVLVFTQIIMKGGLLIIPGTLLILLAIGAATMAWFQVSSKSLKAKLDEKPLPQVSEPFSIAEDEPTHPPPNSVSEGTTELLPAKTPETGKINR